MRNNMKIDYPCGVKASDQLLCMSDFFQEADSPPGVPWGPGSSTFCSQLRRCQSTTSQNELGVEMKSSQEHFWQTN